MNVNLLSLEQFRTSPTLQVPCWFGHRTQWCIPNLLACWMGWWLYLWQGKENILHIKRRNSIKGHTFPREKHLTNIASSKKGERSSQVECLFREKGVSKLRHPNIPKNHSFPKKTGAKSQVFRDRLFPYPNESTGWNISAHSFLCLKCCLFLLGCNIKLFKG